LGDCANVAESIFTGGARRAQVQFAQANSTPPSPIIVARSSKLSVKFRMALRPRGSRSGLPVQQQALTHHAAIWISPPAGTKAASSATSMLSPRNRLFLTNEQQLAVLQGQKLVTSVLLVKALGGGWDASSLAAIQVKAHPKDIIALRTVPSFPSCRKEHRACSVLLPQN